MFWNDPSLYSVNLPYREFPIPTQIPGQAWGAQKLFPQSFGVPQTLGVPPTFGVPQSFGVPPTFGSFFPPLNVPMGAINPYLQQTPTIHPYLQQTPTIPPYLQQPGIAPFFQGATMNPFVPPVQMPQMWNWFRPFVF